MRFSVIIPAHNSAGYIEKALQSVKSQEFKDYELIVVCDRCTDDTEKIAQQYGARTISVDYGLDGMARNVGIDVAQGDWILFMDDDDWWLHEYVLAMLDSVIDQNEEDMLCFGFIWKGVGYARQTKDQVYLAVWSKCWRSSFIGDTRFPAVPYWSDVGFNQAIAEKHPKVMFWNMPLYYYNYLREGSISWRAEQGEIERYHAE